jgi:predicted ATPase
LLTTLAISGYRSLRGVRLELETLNVVTGANGSGKSSLYRALRLLADTAHGDITRALALEGGLGSVLWAGPSRDKQVSLKMGFTYEDYGYAIDLGLPIPNVLSHFNYDPHIKVESLWIGQILRPRNEIAHRRGPAVRVRDGDGHWQDVINSLSPFDSMMTHASDPKGARELLMVRESMRNWRFYDHFRTDRDAPARQAQIGTYTAVLSSDGADLAAAVATIYEIGQREDFDAALEDAFPGAGLKIENRDGYFDLGMSQPSIFRPLPMAALSDGTLRYLLLMAALLSPRPPLLMVLNEPEMSLHPDMLPPLGRLIAQAANRGQIIVISHARELVSAIEAAGGAKRFFLQKREGETRILDQEIEGDPVDEPPWEWPSR